MGRLSGSSTARPSIWNGLANGCVGGQRHGAGDGHRRHAWLVRQPFDERLVEPQEVVSGPVAREVAEHFGRQHALGAIARRDALQAMETGQQQPGARQQHDRHGHLRDHQALLQAPPSRPLAAGAGLLERAGRRRARRQGGKRAEDHAGQQRQAERKAQHALVERHVVNARGEPARKRRQRVDGAPGDDQAHGATGQRQQHAFGEQLAADLPAAGAKRRPQRQLALARQRAGHRQAGDVGARDQQHQQRRADQHEQHRPRVSRQLAQQVHGRGLKALAVAVHVGVIAPEPVRDGGHRGRGLCKRDARLQAVRRPAAPRRRGAARRCAARPRRGTGRPTSACRRRSRPDTAESAAARRRRCAAGRSSGRSGRRCAGSPPNRVRQYSWLRTSTAGAPASSSPSTKVRPSLGRTPSTSKKLAETTPVSTRSGSPRFNRSNDIWWNSTRPLKPVSCWR